MDTNINHNIDAVTLRILTDGKAGDTAPLLGIAEALGVEPDVRVVAPRAPWVWAMPFGPVPPGDGPDRPGSPVGPPFPDVCLAAGRRAVAYLRALKAASPETVTVFYRDPRTRRHGADLLVVQAHDGLSGEGVLTAVTGPHRLSQARLAAARAAPPPALAALAAPRVAVLVGGDSRHHRFAEGDIETFAGGLRQAAATPASLMITASRRTPARLAAALADLAREPGVFLWDGSGDNPLVAMLALADAVVVTADSTNMVGEATAAGVPVHVFRPSGGHAKFDRFLAALSGIAAIRPFPGPLDLGRTGPVDATPAIAARILDLLGGRRAGVSRSAPPGRS